MTYRMSITRSRSKVARRAAGALALMLLVAGCSGPWNEGPVRTESRQVGEFQSIDLRGAANASLQIGPATSLSVTAGENTLHNLVTEVRSGTLVVEPTGKGWLFNPGKVELKITVPALREAVISGAGNLDIADASGQSLQLSLQGAGNLTASGEVQELAVTINGAGNARLSALRAHKASVMLNGAGNITVQATEELSAVVNGVGSVRYIGEPRKLDTQVNGVGGVSQLLPSMTVEAF